MKFSRTVAAVATTAALLSGGVAVPLSPATAASLNAFDTLSWPQAKAMPGSTVEITPKGTIPDDVRFEGSDDYLGYRYTTDPHTGVVTMHIADDVIPNERAQFVIHATDGVHERDYTFEVKVVGTTGQMAEHSSLEYYPALTVEDGTNSVLSVAQLQGDFPEGTRFEVTAPDHFEVTAADNGDLSVTQLDAVKPGSKTAAGVTAIFPDGSTRTLVADIYAYSKELNESLGNGASIDDFFNTIYDNALTPAWGKREMMGSEPASATLRTDLPEGTTFKTRPDLSPFIFRIMDIDVDERSGEVVVTPKRPIIKGWKFHVPVEATTPDNQIGLGWAAFSVTESGMWDFETFKVTYPQTSTPTPEKATAKPQGNFPKGTTFELRQKPPAGWRAHIDRNTGEITVTPPARTKPGTGVRMPVRVHFPDGSRDVAEATFAFTKPEVAQADKVKVRYPTAVLKPGGSVTVRPTNLPEGATVTVEKWNNRDLKFNVDESTGAITITAPKDAHTRQTGEYVTVTYNDGTQNHATLPLRINKATPSTDTPSTDTPKPAAPAVSDTAPSKSKPSTAAPSDPAPANNAQPAATNDGSSTGGIIAIVLGVLALLGGAAFAATQMGALPF